MVRLRFPVHCQPITPRPGVRRRDAGPNEQVRHEVAWQRHPEGGRGAVRLFVPRRVGQRRAQWVGSSGEVRAGAVLRLASSLPPSPPSTEAVPSFSFYLSILTHPTLPPYERPRREAACTWATSRPIKSTAMEPARGPTVACTRGSGIAIRCTAVASLPQATVRNLTSASRSSYIFSYIPTNPKPDPTQMAPKGARTLATGTARPGMGRGCSSTRTAARTSGSG